MRCTNTPNSRDAFGKGRKNVSFYFWNGSPCAQQHAGRPRWRGVERDGAAWDNPARPAFSRRRTALRKRNERKERREDAQSKGQHLTLLEHGDAMDRWLWQAAPEMRKRVEFRATRLRTRSKARGTHSARPGSPAKCSQVNVAPLTLLHLPPTLLCTPRAESEEH